MIEIENKDKINFGVSYYMYRQIHIVLC